MQLRLEATLSTPVHHSASASSSTASPSSACPTFPYVSASRARKYGRVHSCHVARQAAKALAYLRNPLLSLSLLAQHPTPQDSSPRQPEREPLLARERNHCLCPLLGYLPCPADLMEPGGKE